MKTAALLFLIFISSASAIDLQNTTNYRVAPDQEQAEELCLITDNMTLEGSFLDDIFAFGSEANLSGHFQNDVWLCANSGNFSGIAHDHFRLIANTFTITGTISNGLAAGVTSLQISTGATVRGNMYLLAENITTEGEIFGNVHILADRATIAGVIHGSVHVMAQDIVVMPETTIHGNLEYTLGKELVLGKSVHLKGELIRKPVTKAAKKTPLPPAQRLFIQLFFLLAALLSGACFIGIFPDYAKRTAKTLRENSLRSALIGAVAFCLLPMLGLFALFTFIGIPLSVLLFTSYGLLLYLGKIIAAIALGGYVFRRGEKQSAFQILVTMTLGLVLLYSLVMLPVIGTIAWLTSVFLGMGSMLMTLTGKTAGPISTEIKETTNSDPSNEGSA